MPPTELAPARIREEPELVTGFETAGLFVNPWGELESFDRDASGKSMASVSDVVAKEGHGDFRECLLVHAKDCP